MDDVGSVARAMDKECQRCVNATGKVQFACRQAFSYCVLKSNGTSMLPGTAWPLLCAGVKRQRRTASVAARSSSREPLRWITVALFG
ncbi:hypothetical protein G6F63_016804 [Rhizopus arrhizus]|nr:hypothetical protein G6F63_016804 [Rhizopus arrhizus]